MITQEEKTLILGALFHDIGKFEHRFRKYKEELMLLNATEYIDKNIIFYGENDGK